MEFDIWELLKTHNFIAKRSLRIFSAGNFRFLRFDGRFTWFSGGVSPLSACRRRTLAVKRHPAPQVDHDRLHGNLRFCAHQRYTSDRFTGNFLSGTKHMLHPRTNARELVIAGTDVGLVAALAIIIARDLVSELVGL